MRRLLSFATATALAAGAAFSQELVNEEGGRVRRFVRAPAEGPHIYYEAGAARNRFAQRFLTARIRVRLDPGADPARVARDARVRHLRAVAFMPGYHLFGVSSPDETVAALARLRATAGVAEADVLLARWRAKKLTPNDTFFTNQWHLANNGQVGGTAGVDINITNTWDTYRGSNIWIGIVDDGLQTTHPDLAPNVDTNIDFDWNDASSNDPNPDVTSDFHGTACAGLAACRGDNGFGMSGAAPQATLVGLRLIAAPNTDQDEAEALLHSNSIIHVKSNSWGPADDGMTLERPGPAMNAALGNSVTTGRGGKGTILLWAAGNGLEANDNANYDAYANSVYTIAIAAIDDDGIQAYYSEPGACIVVAAPGSTLNIGTTDLVGNNGYNAVGGDDLYDANYTTNFNGTSAATPIAAGVVALMLEANTNLGWRDVQEILIQTAQKNSPSDPEWTNNATGFHFNHKYGAGAIDAGAAVTAAETWTNLAPQIGVGRSRTNLSLAIPDNNGGGVSVAFTVGVFRVEHATVRLSLTHTFRGDLQITLTSPTGMRSILAEQHSDSGDDYANYTLMTVRNWGENSEGVWTLHFADMAALDTGTLHAVELALYGTMLPTNTPPVLQPIADRSGTVSNLLAISVTAVPTEGDAVSLTASNLPAGALFGATNGAGLFTWTAPAQAGVYNVEFYASDDDGYDYQAVTITIGEQAAGTNLIVLYDFDVGTSSVYTAGAETTALHVTAGNLSTADGTASTNLGGNPVSGKCIADSGWSTTSNLTHYFSFTLTNEAGYELEFSSITFDAQRSATGPTNWALRSSADGYAVNLVSGTSTNVGSFVTNSSAVSLVGITNPVTFRLYGYRAGGAAGTWRIDNLRLRGDVMTTSTDQDGDGMEDAWEVAFFGNTTTAGAGTDQDGDHFLDLHEFLAGTAPTNALSYLGVTSASNTAGLGTVVRWQSVSNKTYALHRSTNLVTGFSVVVSNLAANPPLNVYTDTAPVNAGMKSYRVLMQ